MFETDTPSPVDGPDGKSYHCSDMEKHECWHFWEKKVEIFPKLVSEYFLSLLTWENMRNSRVYSICMYRMHKW